MYVRVGLAKRYKLQEFPSVIVIVAMSSSGQRELM